MTTHVNEDDLVLRYYGELDEAGEAWIRVHLETCTACHSEYRRLQRVLAVVDKAALETQELPGHFERTVWARLEPSLRRERGGWLTWFALSPMRVAWMAAVVVLVTAAFFAGRFVPREPQSPAGAVATAAEIRERIFLIDLSEHLDRSQMVLVELVSAAEQGPVDVSGERDRAEQLVSASRLYRRTAAENGDAAVAALLDELERLLIDVAAGPEELSSADLDEMQDRIESHGLLFKVRVLSSEVQARQKASRQERTGQRSSLAP